MGKISQFLGPSLTFVLSVAALICFGLIAASGPGKTLTNLNYVQLNLSPHIGANSSTSGRSSPKTYEIFLFGYCSGSNEAITECSSRQNTFTFNPGQVLGQIFNSSLSNSSYTTFNNHVHDYDMATTGSCVLFYVSFTLICLQIVFGVPGMFRKWANVLTLLVASIAGFLVTLWAIMTTVMFAALRAAFNVDSTTYEVSSKLSASAMVLTWFSVAFVIGAGISWALFSCCGSNRKIRITDFTYNNEGEKRDGAADTEGLSGSSSLSNPTPRDMDRARRQVTRVPLQSWEYMTYSVPFYF